MRLTVVGSGDAFGSGGRLQTCYHLALSNGGEIVVDCGATTLLGFQKLGLDPGRVSTVLLSHLHGDHFAGLVWWLIHAVHVARRTAPLTIAGPPGTEARVLLAAETLFPGSTTTPRRFDLRFEEYAPGTPFVLEPGLEVVAREVSHPSGAPSCALRIGSGRRTLAFSGDTEWVDVLVPIAADADLFICECYGYDTPVRYHIDWRTLEARLPQLSARRILLTHMGAQMLTHLGEIAHPRVVLAEDGLVLDV